MANYFFPTTFQSVRLEFINWKFLIKVFPATNYNSSDKGLPDSGPHSITKNIYRSHSILSHKGALLSVILLGEGGKERA